MSNSSEHPLFRLINLDKSYRVGLSRQRVLKDLNFEFQANQFIAIAGPSGSGKSTLLSLLGGLDSADNGDILYNNQSIGRMHRKQLANLRNREYGFVFQTPYFVPYKSVIENVLLPTAYSDLAIDEATGRAEQLLELIQLKSLMNKSPSLLSGGELQRMSFARAMLLQPNVIFADEPTASLDKENATSILQLLKDVVAGGKSVVMVTHDPYALSWASRVFHLKNGERLDESA